MRFWSDDREAILREALGNDYDAVFANRVDLLADWLVARGLMKAEWVRGTAHYYPHTIEDPMMRKLMHPSYALERPVVGRTRTDLLKLHKRNQMILWQQGSWNTDPA